MALDEWPQFAALAPSIWSVHRDSDEMGAALAHLVLDAMGGAEPRMEITPTEFHPR